MAQIVDIIHRLSFQADTDVLEAVNAEFGKELKQLDELKKKEAEYAALLERTGQNDINRRRVIEGLLNRTRTQYDQIATSIGRQTAANDRLNQSLVQTGRNLSSLSFAGSQLLREAPAFTYSLQTGILALSNNIPILLDQLRQARAQGASTAEVYRALGQSIFGLTGLITIAVAALTIFAGKIFNSGKEAEKTAASIDQVTAALDRQAKALQNVDNFRDEGSNAARRELEAIKARTEAYESSYQKELEIYNGEKQIRAQEKTDLTNRIKLYESLKIALRTGRGTDAQQARRFAQAISGFSADDQRTFNEAYKNGTLTNRLINERIGLLKEEEKALDNTAKAEEEAFGNKRISNIQKLNKELENLIETNEFTFQKLRAQRGLSEYEEIKRINELELQEQERKLDKEIEQAELAGTLTAKTQQKFDDIRLQLRKTANEKLLQENIKYFEKEKQEFEKLINESLFYPTQTDSLNKVPGNDAYLKSVNDGIKAGFKADEEAANRDKKMIKDSLDYALNTTIQTLQQIYEAQAYYLDREIELRRRRVEEATELAEKGNTEILEAEKNRLQQAEAERERVAHRQLQLNAILQASSAAITATQALQVVTNAGATGDPYSTAARIAAAVAALAAGFAFVTNLTQAFKFKDGTIDLNGPGTETSDSIPARLSKGESVMTAAETRKYKPFLQAMRDGTFDNMVAVTKDPVMVGRNAYDYNRLEKKLDGVIGAVESSKLKQDIFFNEHGVGLMTSKAVKREQNRWRG